MNHEPHEHSLHHDNAVDYRAEVAYFDNQQLTPQPNLSDDYTYQSFAGYGLTNTSVHNDTSITGNPPGIVYPFYQQ